MLIKENVDKYINVRLDYDFVNNNEFNKEIAYYAQDKDVCGKMRILINRTKEIEAEKYSRFGLYLLSKFVSYNEAVKLYEKKYIIDFSKVEKYAGYNGTLYYRFKNAYWSDDITFKDLTNRFLIYNYRAYSYSEDTIDVDYNISLLNCEDYDENNYFSERHKIIGPNLYMVMKWLISTGKLTIIDKINYIMFYFNDQKTFHLARTEDNDVYFREKDFDYAINTIFEKLL